MKILYTNFHRGSGGGHTTYVRELARALGTRHQVHVAAPPGSRLLREALLLPGVATLAQPFPNGLRRLCERARAIHQLRGYLRAQRFDIIHVNGSADHRLVIAALRRVKPRPRVVLTKHNTKPMRGLRHVWRARRHTDKVIAVCDYVRRQLAASPYHVCAPQTVCNGVDTARFRPWPLAQARAERRVFTAAADVLLIGSNAGTADYKGWTELVAALCLLPTEQRQRVHVAIAGQPPSARQLTLVQAAGLEAQFHFPGLLDDVRPLIAALDAGFVLSHAVETISFACREMLAMGKPVLVTDYAGLPENIRPGKTGWVVPVHAPAAIAACLRWMLAQRDTLPGMGAAARAQAVAEFGSERFVAATEAIYRALLGRP